MSPTTNERRSHGRIALKGTVTVRAGNHVIHGRIHDLSIGGAYIHTRFTAPLRMLARSILVEIRLDAQKAEWLPTTGRITRIDPDGIAIVFDETAPISTLLDTMGHASDANSRVFSVVLVDDDAQRGHDRATAFRGAGCDVTFSSTPLEAIVRLGEASFEPDVIVIADTLSNAADELRIFMDHVHPSVRLVALGTGDRDVVRVVLSGIPVS